MFNWLHKKEEAQQERLNDVHLRSLINIAEMLEGCATISAKMYEDGADICENLMGGKDIAAHLQTCYYAPLTGTKALWAKFPLADLDHSEAEVSRLYALAVGGQHKITGETPSEVCAATKGLIDTITGVYAVNGIEPLTDKWVIDILQDPTMLSDADFYMPTMKSMAEYINTLEGTNTDFDSLYAYVAEKMDTAGHTVDEMVSVTICRALFNGSLNTGFVDDLLTESYKNLPAHVISNSLSVYYAMVGRLSEDVTVLRSTELAKKSVMLAQERLKLTLFMLTQMRVLGYAQTHASSQLEKDTIKQDPEAVHSVMH